MNVFLEPYRVLWRVYSEGAHLKLALKELGSGNHGRTVSYAYGVLEHDRYLDLCVASIVRKPPKPAIRLILKIAIFARLYADMPPAVSVNEAVSLAKILGKGAQAGFLNASLRAFDEAKVHVPAGSEGLAVRSNFPLFAVKELEAAYGPRAERILLAKSRGVTVRFERDAARYLLLPHTETPFPDVVIFDRFVRDEGYDRGDYTFQSIGSVAICSVVEPCERLLDACAAPGGKSVLLAKRCKEVTAAELHPHRVALIEQYKCRMGAENVHVVQADSTKFRPEFAEAFDGVLVDAPCSGLGTVSENPDLPLRKTEEDVENITAVQQALLDTCSRYVGRGGVLYYSTCSVLPRENDGAVERFLRRHPDFLPEEADSPLAHERGKFGLCFLPDAAFGAGFYVSKLRRS